MGCLLFVDRCLWFVVCCAMFLSYCFFLYVACSLLSDFYVCFVVFVA